jgi:hypothetical protein
LCAIYVVKEQNMSEAKKFRRVGAKTEITPSPEFKSLEKLPIELQKYQLQQFIPTTELGRLAQTSKQNLILTEKELKERPNRPFEALREMNNILRILEYQIEYPAPFDFGGRRNAAEMLIDEYLKLLYGYDFNNHIQLLQQLLDVGFNYVLHSKVFTLYSKPQDWKLMIKFIVIHHNLDREHTYNWSIFVMNFIEMMRQSPVETKTKSRFIYENFEPLVQFLIWTGTSSLWSPLLAMTKDWTNEMSSKYNNLLANAESKWPNGGIYYIGFPISEDGD